MKFQSFQEIIAWQKGRTLTNSIYRLFSNCKDYGLKDQIQRASVSILCNIAEGYGRGTKKEFIRFLDISKGSAYEVQSLLEIAKDLHYINAENHRDLYNKCEEIIKILFGLIKQLKISNANNLALSS